MRRLGEGVVGEEDRPPAVDDSEQQEAGRWARSARDGDPPWPWKLGPEQQARRVGHRDRRSRWTQSPGSTPGSVVLLIMGLLVLAEAGVNRRVQRWLVHFAARAALTVRSFERVDQPAGRRRRRSRQWCSSWCRRRARLGRASASATARVTASVSAPASAPASAASHPRSRVMPRAHGELHAPACKSLSDNCEVSESSL